VGKIGPPGERHRYRFDTVIPGGKAFRLLTSTGHVKFSGFILGDFGGPEPLEEYGCEQGCESIQYRDGRRWVGLFVSASQADEPPLRHSA
jgi:hypothetical protein